MLRKVTQLLPSGHVGGPNELGIRSHHALEVVSGVVVHVVFESEEEYIELFCSLL
jgi:hypothetical protein